MSAIGSNCLWAGLFTPDTFISESFPPILSIEWCSSVMHSASGFSPAKVWPFNCAAAVPSFNPPVFYFLSTSPIF